jgi:hypothetical protein
MKLGHRVSVFFPLHPNSISIRFGFYYEFKEKLHFLAQTG